MTQEMLQTASASHKQMICLLFHKLLQAVEILCKWQMQLKKKKKINPSRHLIHHLMMIKPWQHLLHIWLVINRDQWIQRWHWQKNKDQRKKLKRKRSSKLFRKVIPQQHSQDQSKFQILRKRQKRIRVLPQKKKTKMKRPIIQQKMLDQKSKALWRN